MLIHEAADRAAEPSSALEENHTVKKIAATILLVVTITGASATAAFAKHGADDAKTGRIDCRHHDTVCVVR